MNTPALPDLEAFAAVARHKSYRRAATLRGVAPSTLSDAIRRLEATLGVRLLHRTTRSVAPTEAGERLLDRLVPALAEITAALDTLAADPATPAGTLRLNVPTIVARRVLPPIVAGFLAAHPAIRLEIVADDAFVDVLAAGFDAGVRYDERLDADMIAIPIGPRTQRFAVAAAPAWLDRHGRPSHPRELAGHACIRHRFPSGAIAPWEFERDGETIRVDPVGRLVATTIDLEIAAAVAGLGIITTFEDFLAEAFAEGTLERLLEDWTPPFSGPRLYFASRRHLPPPLRAFVDHIRALAAG
ncbi:MAG: LysR family transcriptional regulator [bacterium]|nr:LysR family transcriptional regulator [Myxococcales bacterium]